MVSYMAMAHSHVQRMLREGLELESIEQDCGGDYRFRHGTAVYYLSVGRGGHLLKIWSQAAYGVKPTKSFLREVNSANERLMHCRAYMSGETLVLEAFLPIETLVPRYLAAVCHEVGSTADRVGQLLAAVHGGHVAFEDETEEAGMTAEDLRRETGPCPACGANAANPVMWGAQTVRPAGYGRHR